MFIFAPQLDDPTKAIKICTEALELDPNDAATLCDRADAYLNNDDYENGKLQLKSFLKTFD